MREGRACGVFPPFRGIALRLPHRRSLVRWGTTDRRASTLRPTRHSERPHHDELQASAGNRDPGHRPCGRLFDQRRWPGSQRRVRRGSSGGLSTGGDRGTGGSSNLGGATVGDSGGGGATDTGGATGVGGNSSGGSIGSGGSSSTGGVLGTGGATFSANCGCCASLYCPNGDTFVWSCPQEPLPTQLTSRATATRFCP